jgi:hypothetical protein
MKLIVYFNLLKIMLLDEKKKIKKEIYDIAHSFFINRIDRFNLKNYLNYIFWNDYYKSGIIVWLLRTIFLFPFIFLWIYFFRFFLGFFGLWLNFFLKRFFIIISLLFYHWETYIYETKKKEKDKAQKANDRYVYFQNISNIFDTDIKAYLNNYKNYKHTFFIKKWIMYIYILILATFNYFINLSGLIRRKIPYYRKIIQENKEDYGPNLLGYIMRPILKSCKKFVHFNFNWVFFLLHVGIFSNRFIYKVKFVYKVLSLKIFLFNKRWFLQKVEIFPMFIKSENPILFNYISIIKEQKKLYDDLFLLHKYYIYFLHKWDIRDNKYLTYLYLHYKKHKSFLLLKKKKNIEKFEIQDIKLFYLLTARIIRFFYLLWCKVYFHVTFIEDKIMIVYTFIKKKIIRYIRIIIAFFKAIYDYIPYMFRPLKLLYSYIKIFFLFILFICIYIKNKIKRRG